MRSLCPISLALDLFGDPWSLLVIRDLMFRGVSHYNGFLCAGEGIATNVLSDRLARLEASGFVIKAEDPADGRRHVYSLTDKGADLAPVLSAIVVWAAKHTETDADADVVEALASGGGRPAGR